MATDGYHFSAAYFAAVRASGWRQLVYVDGAVAPPTDVDVVVNQNAGAERLAYPANGALYLLGSQYVVLRREIRLATSGPSATHQHGIRVLVTFGGADPAGMTTVAIEALRAAAVDGLTARIVCGAEHPDPSAVSAAAQALSGQATVVQDAREMAPHMTWASLAITAAGSTCWELAYLGVPMVVVPVTENQRAVAAGLEDAGAAVSLGTPGRPPEAAAIADAVASLAADPERRATMATAGRALVDGRGGERIAAVLAALDAPRLDGDNVTVRMARADDLMPLWRLSNDAELRHHSFDRAEIPLNRHREWFRDRLSRENSVLAVLDVGGTPAAQVRYDRDGDGVLMVHFAVTPAFRGKGLGTRALSDTWRLACERLRATRIRGVVMQSNEASARAFVAAGYSCVGKTAERKHPCLIFQRDFP